jgi:translation initiation factor IF-2
MAKQDLQANDVILEDYGGDIPSVGVSSVTGEGLVELLETIAGVAELKDLKAEKEGVRLEGTVLEAKRDVKVG